MFLIRFYKRYDGRWFRISYLQQIILNLNYNIGLTKFEKNSHGNGQSQKCTIDRYDRYYVKL